MFCPSIFNSVTSFFLGFLLKHNCRPDQHAVGIPKSSSVAKAFSTQACKAVKKIIVCLLRPPYSHEYTSENEEGWIIQLILESRSEIMLTYRCKIPPTVGE